MPAEMRLDVPVLCACHPTYSLQQLRRSSHTGARRGQDGISSEVLDIVAKEGVLRELGESDLADSTRQEALLAR